MMKVYINSQTANRKWQRMSWISKFCLFCLFFLNLDEIKDISSPLTQCGIYFICIDWFFSTGGSGCTFEQVAFQNSAVTKAISCLSLLIFTHTVEIGIVYFKKKDYHLMLVVNEIRLKFQTQRTRLCAHFDFPGCSNYSHQRSFSLTEHRYDASLSAFTTICPNSTFGSPIFLIIIARKFYP